MTSSSRGSSSGLGREATPAAVRGETEEEESWLLALSEVDQKDWTMVAPAAVRDWTLEGVEAIGEAASKVELLWVGGAWAMECAPAAVRVALEVSECIVEVGLEAGVGAAAAGV